MPPSNNVRITILQFIKDKGAGESICTGLVNLVTAEFVQGNTVMVQLHQHIYNKEEPLALQCSAFGG